jgi:hypothetical protein
LDLPGFGEDVLEDVTLQYDDALRLAQLGRGVQRCLVQNSGFPAREFGFC